MSQRAERVAEMIKQEISQLLHRGLKDPRIGFVTITDAEVTGDLRSAKVYISVYGNEKQKHDSMEGLQAATGFIRREIGKFLKLRFTPELTFKFDESVEYGTRINEVITDLKRHNGLGSDPAEDDLDDEYDEDDDEYEDDEYDEDDDEHEDDEDDDDDDVKPGDR